MEAEITLYIYHVGEFVRGLRCVDQAKEIMGRDGGTRSYGSKVGLASGAGRRPHATATSGTIATANATAVGERCRGGREDGAREGEVAGVPT